jgi:hypothetical protein
MNRRSAVSTVLSAKANILGALLSLFVTQLVECIPDSLDRNGSQFGAGCGGAIKPLND